jgi:sugar/nucleoside kinase (ribokinase family)
MNPCEVVTIGSATQDVFIMSKGAQIMRLQSFEAEQAFLALPYGAKIDVDEMFISTGGGALNTAFTFRRFGLSTAMIAKVGQDRSGDIIRERVREEGIDDSLIVADPEQRTGYSAILTGLSGDRTVLVYRGATLHLRESEIDWERLKGAKLIFVGSLSGETAALYPKLAEFCAEHGILFASNPGSTQFRQGLGACCAFVCRADVLIMNKEEAYTLTGVEPRRGSHDEREMLRMLRDAGAKRAVITEGAKGCQAIDEAAYYSVPACKAKVASTLGAGDAFGSACTAALLKGEPFARALRFGAVNAARVVSSIGAKRGILTWDEAVAAVDECEASSRAR